MFVDIIVDYYQSLKDFKKKKKILYTILLFILHYIQAQPLSNVSDGYK